MTTTNFPNGLTAFGVPTMGVSGVPATSGTYWYVSSVTGTAGQPGTLTAPFATITQAQTAASAGDVVVLMSGHAETVSSAGGIVLSKAGVTYVGIGNGAERPTFTFGTATTATVTITGADISISNIISVIALDQVVSPWVISGAGVTFGLPGAPVVCQDGSAILEAVRDVLTTAAANNLNVNIVHQGFTAGTHGVNCVRLVGGRNANVNVNYYGKASTAVVEFLTTPTVDTQVSGIFYNSGTTDLSKDVVDTATGSTWSVVGFDAAAGLSFDGGSGKAIAGNDTSTVIATLAVPSADATTNVNERDVIGNKTDAAVTTVGTTKSILAYAKGIITNLLVQSADSTANVNAADVIGNKTDAAVYVSGTTKSLAAYEKGHADLQEKFTTSATAILADGTTIFTIAGGPIQITSLISECVVGGDAAAATVQYSATVTGLSAQTLSAASGSTANAAAHATVSLIGTALSTAAVYNSKGANLGMSPPGGIVVPVGVITTVIGGANTTTGTWRHIMRWRPLVPGVTVS